ncbi:uncharacterized protein [Gossypium hirsutum]|uniref:Uncharacterized protein n=1 Tax=Gossypium hirsutum TaxID=3635 RepID=A0ABM3BSB8_GOSHI|nr:uncharacterized protein LOC121229495 [Gossypium hirsutum]
MNLFIISLLTQINIIILPFKLISSLLFSHFFIFFSLLVDVKMIKGKEKVSNEAATKPLDVSITQSPTLPNLPPRNRSDTISRRFGANESQWGSEEEEDVYDDDNTEEILVQDFQRYLQEIHRRIQATLKTQRWKPFAGA